jgi:type VI secretion system ImpM family protein
MGATNSTTLGVLGYLPGQADFVRVRAAGREVRRLEDWLERGLHQARWDMGAGFAVAYPRLFHRFVFRPDNSQMVVLGVLCASVDSHQRPFPFVAFELVPTTAWDQDPLALIGRNSAFFVAMEHLVRALGPLAHIGQVHGQVASTNAPVQLADSPAAATESKDCEDERYNNFLQETTCGELGGPDSGAGLSLCHDLLGRLGSGQDPRQLRFALALPLSRPLFARELELRFYLSLLQTLVAEQKPTLTLFWQLGGAGPGSLRLSFREPTLDVFCSLIHQGGLASPLGVRGVCHPGAGPVPLARPLPELTAATSLGTLLELTGDRAQRDRANQRNRNGARP